MRAKSGHIIFTPSVTFKKLIPVYEDLYLKFLEETGMMPEEEETAQMYLRANLMDLEKDRKPEGFNRPGDMRLIFPLGKNRVNFYVYHPMKSTRVVKVTERLSKILQKKGFKHTVEWDQMAIDEYKKNK